MDEVSSVYGGLLQTQLAGGGGDSGPCRALSPGVWVAVSVASWSGREMVGFSRCSVVFRFGGVTCGLEGAG
jgi:hypothetical protein